MGKSHLKSPLGKNDPLAQRLRRLRAVVEPGLGAAAFAVKYGFGIQQWSNFENGYPLSRTAANRLCDRIPGLTIDWLQRGETGGLTVQLATRLQDAA
jgi:hypothetical protein